MKLGTLKKCVKRIYDKLGVYNRAAAASAYARMMAERGEE
jgi:DNA-binding NarL/FixJ family response regulator